MRASAVRPGYYRMDGNGTKTAIVEEVYITRTQHQAWTGKPDDGIGQDHVRVTVVYRDLTRGEMQRDTEDYNRDANTTWHYNTVPLATPKKG